MTSAAAPPAPPPHHQANQPLHPQTPNPVQAASPPNNKRDLKSWWRGFKLPSKHHEAQESRPQGIFGVPLRQSITYANVAISHIDENGKSYTYGYVPIVVAKCGVFLKEKATGVEGIFRLSGSEKRIKELKTIFDSPDRYGKGLVWDNYTVHDAANVLRRYLNDLPEPVVPLDLYEKFRDPLRGATKQGVGDTEGPQFVENFDMDAAISRYQRLIKELPPLNRQLLLYILDLLAVFASKSDENRMNSQNLAAIFQPGMLSHPNHAMAPEEYRLNQCVIIFLIENQDHFLIEMQGTATDEKTIREVQKETPTPVIKTPATPVPNRKNSIVRSSSNASAGAESVAKEGKIRRNKSVSSRHSRQSTSAPSPGGGSPALATTPTGGLARSNTVPSKKSPGLQSGRFQPKMDPSSTPVAPLTPVTPSAAALAPPPPAVVEEVPAPPEETPSRQTVAAGKSTEGLLDPAAEAITTPSRERNLQSLFQRSPTGESDKRPPNKLRKKKLPGSTNPSAQSSTVSLAHSAVSPGLEAPNPLEPMPSPLPSEQLQREVTDKRRSATETPSESTPRASQLRPSNALHPETAEHNLKAKRSPPTSLHSSLNEGSDFDLGEEILPTADNLEKEKDRKKRWRLSRKKEDPPPTSNPGYTSPRKVLGVNNNAEMSTSSVGSNGDKPRRSFTGESSNPTLFSGDERESGSKESKDEPRGLTSWIKKYRRNKSPPADRPNLGPPTLSTRGKSLEIPRSSNESKTQVQTQAQTQAQTQEPKAAQ